jgi:hypothetical protein
MVVRASAGLPDSELARTLTLQPTRFLTAPCEFVVTYPRTAAYCLYFHDIRRPLHMRNASNFYLFLGGHSEGKSHSLTGI